MRHIEQSIRPGRQTETPKVLELDNDSKYRLSAQFRRDPEKRATVMMVGNEMVPDVLADIRTRLGSPRLIESEEPEHTIWDQKDSKHLMTAVHILNIADKRVDYGPISGGTRTTITSNLELLKEVKKILDDSAGSVDAAIRGPIMDEVSFTIFSALREDRDTRRQKETAMKNQTLGKTEILVPELPVDDLAETYKVLESV